MPTCRITDSRPNVRPSSGTIGTISLPISGSFSRCRSMLTNPIVVETARPFDPAVHSANDSSSGALKSIFGTSRFGMYPPSPCRRCVHVHHLRRILRRTIQRPRLRRLLRNRNARTASDERHQRLVRQLLLLVRRIARLRAAQPVTLHRLRQNHRRPALVLHRPLVRVVDLHSRSCPPRCRWNNLIVRHVLHQLQQLRILPEEFASYIRAALRLERLDTRRPRTLPSASAAAPCGRARTARPSPNPRSP